jgi:uncharacterized protein with NAD-binding domain and iron-sulfur cluster
MKTNKVDKNIQHLLFKVTLRQRIVKHGMKTKYAKEASTKTATPLPSTCHQHRITLSRLELRDNVTPETKQTNEQTNIIHNNQQHFTYTANATVTHLPVRLINNILQFWRKLPKM